MKEQWSKIKNKWASLANREQRAIILGSMCVGIFIVYQFIWVALINHIALLRQTINKDQVTLTWMQKVDREIQKIETQTKNKNTVTSPIASLSYLQKQTIQLSLASQLSELKQISYDSVIINFKEIEFDKFIQLLALVVKECPVAITQLTIGAGSTPGMVVCAAEFKVVGVRA